MTTPTASTLTIIRSAFAVVGADRTAKVRALVEAERELGYQVAYVKATRECLDRAEARLAALALEVHVCRVALLGAADEPAPCAPCDRGNTGDCAHHCRCPESP